MVLYVVRIKHHLMVVGFSLSYVIFFHFNLIKEKLSLLFYFYIFQCTKDKGRLITYYLPKFPGRS